jgi:hypothetical protein
VYSTGRVLTFLKHLGFFDFPIIKRGSFSEPLFFFQLWRLSILEVNTQTNQGTKEGQSITQVSQLHRFQLTRFHCNNNNNNNNNNNKPEIKIRDKEKGACMLIYVVISVDRNVMKKDGEKILKYNELLTRNSAHVECESKSYTSNNRDNWNHFKIIQTITEQHSRKTRNQGTTKNSHIGWALYTYYGKY